LYHIVHKWEVSKVVQYLKGASSRILLEEFAHLRKQFWDRHFWERETWQLDPVTLTDEVIRQYIDEQEGEPVDDNQFLIDSTL
jgi:putative transposase